MDDGIEGASGGSGQRDGDTDQDAATSGTADSAARTVRRYYDALRAGEPLPPFFADSGPVVKVGIGERLVGAGAVAEGLRDQSRETDYWEVESRDLHVGGDGEEADGGDAETPTLAWFADDVFLAWTDTERNIRFEFDTRWTGSMVRREGEWRFVVVHVSTADDT